MPRPAHGRWVERKDVTVPGEIRHSVYALYRRMGVPLSYVDRAFMDIYRDLEADRLNGHTKAVGRAPHRTHCRIARDLIADKEYAIADLLAAYQSPEGVIPILPHPRCDMLNQEVVEHCCCCWSALPVEIPWVDPKFEAWLDEKLAAARKELQEQGERAFRERLLEQQTAAVRDMEEAVRRLDQLQAEVPVITPEIIAFRRSIAELRQLQRDFGVAGLRKKIDIAQQLIGLPDARSTLEMIATDVHADDVRDAIAEVRYLKERAQALGEALGKQSPG